MIEVRELSPADDLAPVLELCRDFFDEYRQHHQDFFDTDRLTDADIQGRFVESLQSDQQATLVALEDEQVVGYASLAVREQARFYRVRRVGAISALMVAPAYRRRGVATLLLERSRDFFGSRGVRYYTFYTAVANRAAIRLYEKCGLKPLHTSFLGET